MVYASQGKWELALPQYQKAQDIQERLGLQVDLARTYNNIGCAYASCDAPVQALRQYERAREIQERLGLDVHLAITFCNMAQVYYQQNKYPHAEHALELAIAIRKELKYHDVDADLAFLEHIRACQHKNHPLKNFFDKFRKNVIDKILLRTT